MVWIPTLWDTAQFDVDVFDGYSTTDFPTSIIISDSQIIIPSIVDNEAINPFLSKNEVIIPSIVKSDVIKPTTSKKEYVGSISTHE